MGGYCIGVFSIQRWRREGNCLRLRLSRPLTAVMTTVKQQRKWTGDEDDVTEKQSLTEQPLSDTGFVEETVM